MRCRGAQTGSGKTYTMLGPGGDDPAAEPASSDDVRRRPAPPASALHVSVALPCQRLHLTSCQRRCAALQKRCAARLFQA